MTDFLRFLEHAVRTNIKADPETAIRHKLDVLERLIEVARFELRHDRNAVDLRTVLQAKITFADRNRALEIMETQPSLLTNDFLREVDLQAPLLVFLLIRYGRRERVLRTIERFVADIRGQLTALDFERTATGVVRCYTTTRFAANRLREC